MENNNYTQDIEIVLENIRINSVILYEEHHKHYHYLKDILKYYKVPIIVFSGISSIVSVCQNFISQEIITALNISLSFVCSLIGSIELYMGISSQMVNELNSSKGYQVLAMDIQKTLSLNPANRGEDGKTFLEKCYGTYIKLLDTSVMVRKKLKDTLMNLPKEFISHDSSNISSITTV